MIYIFSKIGDFSTNLIIDWLEFFEEKYIRINDEPADSIKYQNLFDQLSKCSINSNKRDKENDVFWFRRPDHKLIQKLSDKELKMEDILYPKFSEDKIYFNSLNTNYKNYLKTFFHLILDDESTRIGSYNKTGLNKIKVLQQAEKLGIKIPPYIVTNDLDELKTFFNENNNDLICKSLFEIVYPLGVNEAGFLLRCLTSQISDITTLPRSFYPSLFQKNIHKEFEIRTFFLEGKCYSGAMFTQNNEKTVTDFRNYDSEKPTRMIPYQLDEELEEKLKQLMTASGLNTGSIDIMKGTDGNYYFLEINPVGQFGFVSEPCNYNFPKIIAQALIKKKNGAVQN